MVSSGAFQERKRLKCNLSRPAHFKSIYRSYENRLAEDLIGGSINTCGKWKSTNEEIPCIRHGHLEASDRPIRRINTR